MLARRRSASTASARARSSLARRARASSTPRADRGRLLREPERVAWLDTVVQGVLLGGLYALFATGLSLIFGVMRLVNLAHGDFSILAAFLAVVAGAGARRSTRCSRSRWWCRSWPRLGYGAAARSSSTGCSAAASCRAVLVTFGLSIIIQNACSRRSRPTRSRLNPGGIETASLPLGGGLAVGWFSAAHARGGRRCCSSACSSSSAAPALGRAFRAAVRRRRDGGAHGHRQPPALRAGHGAVARHRGRRRHLPRHPHDVHVRAAGPTGCSSPSRR